MSSSGDPPSPSILTEGQGGGNKNKFIIIIVSCIGGFVVALILVLILVPFLRRCARRRQSRDLEEAQDRGVGGGHARARSGSGLDPSVPLLSGKSLEIEVFQPYPVREPGREGESEGLEGDEHGEHPPSTENSDEPLTPGSTPGSGRIYNPWSAVSTASPRFLRPSTTLKRARPRIGHTHTPLEPLPEGSRTDPISTPTPSLVLPNEATTPPTSPGSDAHPSWLHVPRPLISAFRKSLAASSISSNASSLPAMQHYPSFNASSSASGERSRSPDTFHSFSSASANSAAVSHSQVLSPVNTNETQNGLLSVPARLKPSAGSEHVATVQRVPPSALPNSRAASFLGGSSMSGTSVYVDARSRVDEESVDGRSR